MFSTFRAKWEQHYSETPALTLFVSILAVSWLVLIVLTLVTHGWALWYTIDFNPQSYIFGDHFDSLVYGMDSPYVKWHVIYPPFIMIVYGCLGWLTSNYETGYGEDQFQILSTSEFPLFVFVVFMIVSLVIFHRIFVKIVSRGYEYSKVDILFFFVLFSLPVMYAIQRGNCVFYALDAILLFLLGYRSENKCIRYLSYVALVVAVNIKLYPALLAFLVLREGRAKEFLFCVIASAALFLVPFLFFEGGLPVFLDTLFNYSSPSADNLGSLIGLRQWIGGIG